MSGSYFLVGSNLKKENMEDFGEKKHRYDRIGEIPKGQIRLDWGL